MTRAVIRAALMIAVAVATEHTAHASPALFGNPFLSADEVQAQRGAVANAEFEIRYRKDDVDWQANVDTSEVVIVLAEDWAAVEQNGRTELLDFKLMRRFEISPAGSTFISFNLNSRLMFAVYERFNRAAMAAAITAAGLPFKVPPACDADTELGVTLPPSRAPSQVELTQSADSISATCDGRQIGLLKLAAKDAPPPPATFWPALVASFQIHPLILAAAQKVGGVPTHLESTFSVMEQKTTRSWDLVYARAETKPYPLSAQLRNATVDWLAGTVGAPLAQTAVDALQGKAGGGPPTAASSERTLAALVEANDPAAAMALLPTIGMFPDVLAGCRAGGKSAGCAIVAGLPTYMAADPAVAAVFKMIAPHAPNDTEWPAKALNDMVAAQKSPLGGSPILAGVFANIVRSAGPGFQAEASAKGLVSDPQALTSAAIQAYPYNPAWWLDLANSFIDRYDSYTGLVLADIAISLPMPEALRGNPMVTDRQQRLSALMADYPAFGCCRSTSGSNSPGDTKN